jgi:hypothetical protein
MIRNYCFLRKGEDFPVNDTKAYRGSICMAPLILNLDPGLDDFGEKKHLLFLTYFESRTVHPIA